MGSSYCKTICIRCTSMCVFEVNNLDSNGTKNGIKQFIHKLSVEIFLEKLLFQLRVDNRNKLFGWITEIEEAIACKSKNSPWSLQFDANWFRTVETVKNQEYLLKTRITLWIIYNPHLISWTIDSNENYA